MSPDGVTGRRRGAIKVAGVVLVCVAMLLVTGMLYEHVSSARALSQYPPPGRLVNIGDAVIHLYCSGLPGTTPTIVLEAGGGDISLAWRDVQRELSQKHRVCSYDRAGQGWSSPGPQPRTAERIAAELEKVLATAHEGGPYILVGHSRGGIYARTFAQQYSGQVAGVVLVDSSVEKVGHGLRPLKIEQRQARLLMLGRWLAPFGVARLMYGSSGAAREGPAAAETALRFRAAAIEANYEELTAALGGDYGPPIRAGALDCKPLVVLTSTGPLRGLGSLSADDRAEIDAYRVGFQKAQADFLPLSCNHRQIFADRAGHYIYRDDPQLFEAAVEGVISGKLEEIKSGGIGSGPSHSLRTSPNLSDFATRTSRALTSSGVVTPRINHWSALSLSSRRHAN